MRNGQLILSMEKNYRWHKVAESIAELRIGGKTISSFRVAGKDICIALYQDNAFGCAATCPHAGGKLKTGWVDALGQVVCPLHRYKFDLKTGRNTSGEGYFLKTYPVKEDEDGVWVGLEVV